MERKLLCAYRYIGFSLILGFIVNGIILTFALPPFQIPDEAVHWKVAFARAQKVFDLSLEDKDVCSPAGALGEYFEVSKIAFNREESLSAKKFADNNLSNVPLVCIASELNYGSIFTYPGVTLARIFVNKQQQLTTPQVTLNVFYLARLFQGFILAFVLLRFWYLYTKTDSKFTLGGLTLLAISLSPLFIQQSFGISADMITFAVLVSCVQVYLVYNKQSSYDYFVLLFFMLATASTKPPVLPICLVLLILSIFRHQQRELLFVLRSYYSKTNFALLFICVFSLIVSFVEINKDHTAPDHQKMGREIDAGKQINHIIEHPFESYKLLHRSVSGYVGTPYFVTPLGWLSGHLRERTVATYNRMFKGFVAFELLLLIIFASKYWWKKRVNGFFSMEQVYSVLLLFSVYISCLLISATLYILWTTVANHQVDGLQARYFFPFLMVLPFAVAGLLLPYTFLKKEEQEESVEVIVADCGKQKLFHYALFFVCCFILIYSGKLGVDLFIDLQARYR